MLRRGWEYLMLDPWMVDDLPHGIVQYDLYKEPTGYNQYYGSVIYDRPLTNAEVDRFNFDGPLPVWV